MTSEKVAPTRLLTPKRIRRRLKQINEIDDNRERRRALRQLRRKVLKRIGEGTVVKPRACARAAVETP